MSINNFELRVKGVKYIYKLRTCHLVRIILVESNHCKDSRGKMNLPLNKPYLVNLVDETSTEIVPKLNSIIRKDKWTLY